MTTLSKFQQSELKRFDKKIRGIVIKNLMNYRYNALIVRDNVIYEDEKTTTCIDIFEKELNNLISSSIEKAFALGKEEKEKEILAGLKTLRVKRHSVSIGGRMENCCKCKKDLFIDEITNLLKNK